MREPENVKKLFDSIKEFMTDAELYAILPQKRHRPKTEYIALLQIELETHQEVRVWQNIPLKEGFLESLLPNAVIESRLIGGNECWNPAYRWRKIEENKWQTRYYKNFPMPNCRDQLARQNSHHWVELFVDECRVWVTCSECKREMKETEPTEVTGIESNGLGQDVLYFICPYCGEHAHGLRWTRY